MRVTWGGGEKILPNVSICDDNPNVVWYNGKISEPEYVDLGLRSGNLWMTRPFGMKEETDYENIKYLAFGDTTGYTASEDHVFNWANAPFNNGSSTFNSEYWNQHKNEFIDNGVLKPEYDIIHKIYGGDWYIPTMEDLEELIDNTTKVTTAIPVSQEPSQTLGIAKSTFTVLGADNVNNTTTTTTTTESPTTTTTESPKHYKIVLKSRFNGAELSIPLFHISQTSEIYEDGVDVISSSLDERYPDSTNFYRLLEDCGCDRNSNPRDFPFTVLGVKKTGGATTTPDPSSTTTTTILPTNLSLSEPI